MLGLHETSFEGQGPMQLEAQSTACEDYVDMPLLPGEGGVLRADWEPLVRRLAAADANLGEAASLLHESLARSLVKQAQALCSDADIQVVGLCGGVFQNALLAARCRTLLEECGFHVLQALNIPCNDAGISAGQVMQALGSA